MLSSIMRWCPKGPTVSHPDETTLVSSSVGSDGSGKTYGSEVEVYLSIRITVSHVDVRRLLEKVFHDVDFLCYLHKGSKTKKEHIHVLVPNVSMKKKIRDRLADKGYKGNESYSVKIFKNGICSGIQYCAKEGTVPYHQGDFDIAIMTAPDWVDKRQQTTIDSYVVPKKPAHKETSWQINYQNCIVQAINYARETDQCDKCLRPILQEMFEMTKWQPSKDMMCSGIPEYLCQLYEFKLGRRSKGNIDYSWMEPGNCFKKYDFSAP